MAWWYVICVLLDKRSETEGLTFDSHFQKRDCNCCHWMRGF